MLKTQNAQWIAILFFRVALEEAFDTRFMIGGMWRGEKVSRYRFDNETTASKLRAEFLCKSPVAWGVSDPRGHQPNHLCLKTTATLVKDQWSSTQKIIVFLLDERSWWTISVGISWTPTKFNFLVGTTGVSMIWEEPFPRKLGSRRVLCLYNLSQSCMTAIITVYSRIMADFNSGFVFYSWRLHSD